MNGRSDGVLRAITQDGGLRVISARTTETVARVLRAQEARGRMGQVLGNLVTGVSLFRETMSPGLRVQGILCNANRSITMVADARPGGGARGLYQRREPRDAIAWGAETTLEMMRCLPNGELHRGFVEVTEFTDIADAMMCYLQNSEQVLSMVSLGCVIENDVVKAAGGYLIQLLPELTEEVLTTVTDRLENFENYSQLLKTSDGDPARLLEKLLDGIAFSLVDETPIFFECDCSQVRVMASLATLDRDDLSDMLRTQQQIEMSCDFCNQSYRVSPEQLRGLLSAS